MDPDFHGSLKPSNEFPFARQSMCEFSDWNLGNGSRIEVNYPDRSEQSFERSFQAASDDGGTDLLSNQPFSNSTFSTSCADTEDELQDDCDFSDEVLRYIDQMLMEEDMEDKTHMLQESLDLQAQEKSFYEVIGKKYPPSPLIESEICNQYLDDDSNGYCDGNGYLIDVINQGWSDRKSYSNLSFVQSNKSDHTSSFSVSTSNRLSCVSEVFSDSSISPFQVQEIRESQSVWNFQKGVEEANKFLPRGNILLNNMEKMTQNEIKESERRNEAVFSLSQSNVKKNRHYLDVDLEDERDSKLPAIYTESDLPIEEFDNALLITLGEHRNKFVAYKSDLQDAASKGMQRNGQIKGSGSGKNRGKNRKREVIDLRTLLINCAQAVAADDRRNANEFLKQIRKHSSPFGDGNQRLAHYFADGLEARLAGTGTQIHKSLVSKRTTAADYLKAYYTFLASSPFRKITNFAANKSIIMKSRKETRVHIIDFGILYGFQWPTFIQRIATREGGPPKLRITGVDFPQPGFRPAERIEETGRRLAHYAEKFKVPFEYNAIAQKWETIKVEDLRIEKDEFVVVNCLYRGVNLHDESVLAESSRKVVLNLIRRINPALFIHAVLNGAYSTPFFVTRFREVLFHFSALFDVLDTNIPREKPERLLIEKDIFGREALNVIACEGWERVERPETYKQWQVRHLKAGFCNIPFEREVMKLAIFKVNSGYHKDFVIDEDGDWLLMGWKGRIIYAISCWKPV